MSEDALDGRYQRVALLGSGAMGQVWEALDQRLNRRVAIKALLVTGLDSQGAARMRREAQVAARLHHPNAVTVFDLVIESGRPYLVMELVPGQSLAQRVAIDGPLEVRHAAHVGVLVAAALDAAGRAGIVHRDVKPANVLLGDDGSVKLADFGVARGLQDSTLTETGTVVGTVSFLAPELARGAEATPASDVWALGATLFAAVVGHAPHAWGDGTGTTTILARLLSEPVVVPPECGALAPLLVAMLEQDPARRPTPAQARADLETLARGGTPASLAAPARRFPSGVLVPVLGVVLLAGLLAGGWLLVRPSSPSAAAGPTATAPPAAAPSTAPPTAPPTVPATTPTTQAPAPTTTPPTPTTPPPTTTNAPTTNAPTQVTGAGRQGFADPAARCNADDPAVFAGFTAQSRIVVCRTGDDRYYYKGLRTRDGSGIELDDPVPTGSGFSAVNGETTYDLGADSFTITGPSGVLSEQPWVERTAP